MDLTDDKHTQAFYTLASLFRKNSEDFFLKDSLEVFICSRTIFVKPISKPRDVLTEKSHKGSDRGSDMAMTGYGTSE